jgi:hypothetical protein
VLDNNFFNFVGDFAHVVSLSCIVVVNGGANGAAGVKFHNLLAVAALST